MEIEEAEDEECDTSTTITTSSTGQYQYSCKPNANSEGKVKYVLKKILVAGFVASSAPLVLPPLFVASAIGLAVSMPYALFLASHTCTQNLMNKLLPRPQNPPLLQDFCFQPDIDNDIALKSNEAKSDNEIVHVNEENMIHESEKLCEEEDDNEKLEDKIYGESDGEKSMSGGKIVDEIVNENEESETTPFEFSRVTTVVLEECCDEVKEGDIEEQELQRETKGLLEKIRDECKNDMRGEYEEGICSRTNESDHDIGLVVEKMEDGQSLGNEENSQVFDYKEMLQSRNDDDDNKDIDSSFNEVEESCEYVRGNLEVDSSNDSQKPMTEETYELLDEGTNDMRGEYEEGICRGTNESDQDIGLGIENSQVFDCEEMLQSRNDDNDNEDMDTMFNEVEESCEPVRGNLEVDSSNDLQKPMTEETCEMLDERGFQYESIPAERIRDLLIETQVFDISVAEEDSSEVTNDKTDTLESFQEELEPTILKGKLDDNIPDFENQEMQMREESNIMESSSDADARKIADESVIPSCDENPDAYSYTIDLHNESSNVAVDAHTDSMDVLVSSVELDSKSSECSSGKDIVCPSSEEVVFNEGGIWKEIHAIRKIIGYESTSQASCVDELKALYIFTGVEPPTFVKENPFDPAEVNEKLHFLMSIVGIKPNVP